MNVNGVSDSIPAAVMTKTLVINEIFLSIQGESLKTGLPTAFIRLTGCPLRCRYCDTTYAFHNGSKMQIGNILQTISEYRTPHVTVTGGEPLAQKECAALLRLLCDEGYQVSLETSGAIDVSGIDSRVARILDIKTPGSGEHARNLVQNLDYLGRHDQVKFVICNREDFAWSKQFMFDHRLQDKCEILFSPSHEELPAVQLADWILADRLPVRLQVQLHKYLWGDGPGR